MTHMTHAVHFQLVIAFIATIAVGFMFGLFALHHGLVEIAKSLHGRTVFEREKFYTERHDQEVAINRIRERQGGGVGSSPCRHFTNGPETNHTPAGG